MTEARAARESVLELFERKPSLRLTLREIRAKLDNPSGAAEAVEDLVAEGILWQAGRNRYALAEEMGISRGRLRVRSSGRGVVTSDAGKIEIDPRDIGMALDGDLVLVRRADRTGVSTFRGRILTVLERARTGISGVSRKAGSGWVLDPLDPSLPRGIPLEAAGAVREGDVVWGELTGRDVVLVMRETLGDGSSPDALISGIAKDFAVAGEYPSEARAEAASSAAKPLDLAGREDLRSLLCFTIDPLDARDFDDAVSIREDGDGFELGVHIADVAAYVPTGGRLDSEARARGTSVYLPDRVVPMLPEELSNDACSLRPGEDRLTRTVFLRYDPDGRRTGFRIVPSVIRSSCRLTYEEAFSAMNGESLECRGVSGALATMTSLSRLLDRAREARGALDFGSVEFRISFGSDGYPSAFERVPDDESHRLIENFMVEANRAVAEHCGWLGLPVLYRVHGEPDREALVRLREDLSRLNLSVPSRMVSAADLARLLRAAAGSPAFFLVREAVLHSMMKAVYGASDTGHFGLSLRNYLHFTSPIRRYPDLLVARALQAVENGSAPFLPDPAAAAESCSASEQRAEGAERECVELLALIYLQRRRGSVFEGVVISSEEFGVFTRLLDVPAEGLVPARYLGPGGPQSYRPGSGMRIEVVDSDPALRRLTLRPAGSGG
jgi:ribonuclease R